MKYAEEAVAELCTGIPARAIDATPRVLHAWSESSPYPHSWTDFEWKQFDVGPYARMGIDFGYAPDFSVLRFIKIEIPPRKP